MNTDLPKSVKYTADKAESADRKHRRLTLATFVYEAIIKT